MALSAVCEPRSTASCSKPNTRTASAHAWAGEARGLGAAGITKLPAGGDDVCGSMETSGVAGIDCRFEDEMRCDEQNLTVRRAV
mmetsp:Transcript_4353/g.13932  ORF Transcript_4353/g.13932 Transcript_4353/m.13932 type:complete len:84 (-) Transcript_4353:240-491(-)